MEISHVFHEESGTNDTYPRVYGTPSIEELKMRVAAREQEKNKKKKKGKGKKYINQDIDYLLGNYHE